MKKLLLFAFIVANVLNGFSQIQGINYQAVILDSNAPNNVLVSTNIDIRFTILNETDTEEYQETHNVTTDAYGMVNLQIGQGTVISVNTFADISWVGLSKKLRVEIDFTGSGTYTSLNEQAMTFMPQPVDASITQSINDNTSAITLNTLKVGVPDDSGASNGQVLQTNGSGILSWVTPATSGVTNITGLSDALVEDNSVYLGNDPSATTNSAQYNVAIGTTALDAITSGKTNVAVGYDALTANTTGEHNTATGWSALKSNTTAHYNTAYGYSALNNNTDGTQNTANGPFALHYNTTGSNNTAYGMSAIYGNQTGSNNTANGSNALGFNTNGNYNTAMGAEAGRYLANGSAQNQSGNYNVFLGSATKASGNTQNEIVIGYNAIGNGNNTVQLGNTNITNVNTSGAITAGAVTYPNTDGIANQVLQTDGSGTVTWVTPATVPPIREVADEFSATASQTSFALTQTPSANSKVKMYVNGIRISNTAYSLSGNTITYNAANNGSYNLSVNDRIQFDFYY